MNCVHNNVFIKAMFQYRAQNTREESCVSRQEESVILFLHCSRRHRVSRFPSKQPALVNNAPCPLIKLQGRCGMCVGECREEMTWKLESVRCPLDAVRVTVICLTLMTLKPKSSRLLEISSAGVSGGRWWITAYISFSEFGEKVK
jgi:hypothetical protein